MIEKKLEKLEYIRKAPGRIRKILNGSLTETERHYEQSNAKRLIYQISQIGVTLKRLENSLAYFI